jgi:hypothetical protein
MAKIDLKIKPSKESIKEMPEGPCYPNLYLSDVKLPLSKTSVGKSFKAIVTLRLTGLRENTSTRREGMSWDFDIHNIEFSGKNIAETNAGTKLKETFGK